MINQYIPQSVPHPGITLEEKLEELGMGSKEFAIRSGKPEKTISAILKGDSSITADMAVLFESVTRIPAHYWLNHQLSFDEYKARLKREEELAKAISWAKEFPLAQMVKFGWINQQERDESKVVSLLKFFGISSPKAWADYYLERSLKVAFRISLASTSNPFSVSAWLRQGELEANKIDAPVFDKKELYNSLPYLKSIMVEQPSDFSQRIKETCLSSGVKVVYTPCLTKAPISAATRWINDNPIIQLSGRGKRNDKFWFSFFHEIGHILLHGKKDIFLENITYEDCNEDKENEADEFAVKWTLPREEEERLLAIIEEKTAVGEIVTLEDIVNFAESVNNHPSIVLGRLQHEKILPYTFGSEFFHFIELENQNIELQETI